MPRIRLNRTHPKLFRDILGLALGHLMIGLLFVYAILGTPPSTHSNPTLGVIFTGAFFVIALLMLLGLFMPHYRIIRWGLSLGLLMMLFLSLAFAISIGQKISELQTKQLAWLTVPWGVMAWLHFTCLFEPPYDPATAKEPPPDLVK